MNFRIHTSKRPDESEHQINGRNILPKRTVKVYAVEAVMMKEVKKGSFVRIQLINSTWFIITVDGNFDIVIN